MSVVARRRKPRVSGDSEDFSEDSYDDVDVNKGSQGDTELNVSSEGQRESESETLDEAGESGTDDTTAVDEERDDGDLSDSVVIEYEREEGDGQESVPQKEKKLDDDEDRRNPQYIPKRGTFYEHDDRTAAEDTSTETVEKETERKETEKKKVWKEHENRWSHDRYNEDDQAPKSRDELIAIYGYDIRHEDAPPRARRRRKYGRGPNKYTRNWEDEDAYVKSGAVPPRGARGGRGGRGGNRRPFQQSGDSEEEFPPLISVPSSRGNRNEGGAARGTSNGRGRAPRGRRNVAFPQLSKGGEQDSDSKEENFNEDSSHSSVSNDVPNAWRKEINQNKFQNTKPQEEVSQPLIETSAPMNVGASNSAPSFKGRGPAVNEERKERVEENGWKGRRDRSKPRQQMEEGPMEGQPVGDGNGNWRGRSKGDRRVPQGVGTVESQTYTPSAPRGRGRGQRGGGSGRQTMEFKPSFGGPRPEPQVEAPRRSHSETRMSSQDQGGSADGGLYIQSQVVNRTTDDMVKDLGRVTISEHVQPSNREYPRKQNKPQQNYHQNAERRQPVVPPRMQDSASNKPKRYSSQRQRSLPETAGAPPGPPYAQQPQHAYYPPGYAQPPPEELEGLTVVSSGYGQPPPVYGDSQQATAVPPPGPPPTVVAQQTHPTTTTAPTALALLPPPPHPLPQPQAYAPPPFSSPPTFIPPPVAGPPPRILPPGTATYMTAAPTGAPIINYVAAAPQTQFAPQAFAPFQGFTAVPAPQPPPELFQPQGITYYSPEDQVIQRTITQKRQSTAIPIVPPPDRGPRGRGRLREEQTPTPPGVSHQVVSVEVDSSVCMKDMQVEDAPEEKMSDPAPMENQPSVITTTSSETIEAASEPTISSEMIEAMNVTEIPEVSNAAEAAKAIQAVEEAAAAAAAAASAANTITPPASPANVAPINVPSSEQEIQA